MAETTPEGLTPGYLLNMIAKNAGSIAVRVPEVTGQEFVARSRVNRGADSVTLPTADEITD